MTVSPFAQPRSILQEAWLVPAITPVSATHGDLAGGSARLMRHVLDRLPELARSRAPLVIQGERGTGKRHLAGAIHRLGARRRRPLLIERCSSLTEDHLETLLYGGMAAGGTLVLHGICRLSLSLQGELLHWLGEKRIRPSHDDEPRVVVTSRRCLREAVADGGFMSDLCYRLDVVPVQVPPLRERRDDIPALVRHFLGRDEGRLRLSEDAWDLVLDHAWPGNVEELKVFILKARLLAVGSSIAAEHLVLDRVRRSHRA